MPFIRGGMVWVVFEELQRADNTRMMYNSEYVIAA